MIASLKRKKGAQNADNPDVTAHISACWAWMTGILSWHWRFLNLRASSVIALIQFKINGLVSLGLNGITLLLLVEEENEKLEERSIYERNDRLTLTIFLRFEPIKKLEPPELLLMRTLQKEMWAAALKRGTWFRVPQHD
ncbi:unnamed protein product [Cercopithifilaria johnstoni]|uniref:Uncharacterized protein n=1 Tax=Cercopithifilaria johnstoni TaxID=2874296 RepID=A0A8J2MTA2_9BILA|nr:unnamed protein product [Cercopithifilaria johnstoni]